MLNMFQNIAHPMGQNFLLVIFHIILRISSDQISKTKFAKIGKLIFHSFENIATKTCWTENLFWSLLKGLCMSTGTGPK